MIKKTLAALSIGAAFFASAQDVSTVKNAVEVYGATFPGTAKFNAMAGAAGALGGDISSVNVNPAGVGVAITSDLSGTLNFANSKNTSTLFGTAHDYTTHNTDLGQLGGIAVFDVRGRNGWQFVNLGLNYANTSVEDYVESRGTSNISFPVATDALKFNRHAYDRTGDVTKTTISLGGNYQNRLYLGAALNFHGANISQSDTAELTFASNNAADSFSKQYTPYGETGTGFSASVGVIGKVNNQFRLGAAVETPTWWNIDREYNYYDAADSNNDGVYSESRKIQTPLKATVSAAYVPSKNFALNADYTLGLTKTKFTTDDKDLQDEYAAFYNSNAANMSEVKVGAEYRIQQFRLRGGYSFASSPFGSTGLSTLSANNTAQQMSYSDLYAGKRNTVGVGVGYDFKTFYIDAAYNNVSHQYSSPFLRGSGQAGSQYYSSTAFFSNDNAVVSSVKNVQNNISVTLGWKF